MAPTSASLKTHTGHGNRRDGSSTRENGGGGVGDSEDATHFERHLNGTPGRHRSSSGDPRHRPRRAYHHNHRRFDNLRVDDEGAGVIPTPLQVRESSEVRVSYSKVVFFQILLQFYRYIVSNKNSIKFGITQRENIIFCC
jgi:hypothetical protein